MIATILLAGQRSHQGKGKVMVAAVILFGVGIVGLSQAPNFLVALGFLAMINGMAATNDIL